MRQIFFTLLVSCALASPAAYAEEQLAMSDPSADSAIPLTLLTARNIELELIPDDELATRDLWVRIRSGFAMRDLDSKLVAKYENGTPAVPNMWRA